MREVEGVNCPECRGKGFYPNVDDDVCVMCDGSRILTKWSDEELWVIQWQKGECWVALLSDPGDNVFTETVQKAIESLSFYKMKYRFPLRAFNPFTLEVIPVELLA